jgi:hypothetical protein
MFEDNEIDDKLIEKLLQSGAVRFDEEQVDSLDDWEERHWRFLMLQQTYLRWDLFTKKDQDQMLSMRMEYLQEFLPEQFKKEIKEAVLKLVSCQTCSVKKK